MAHVPCDQRMQQGVGICRCFRSSLLHGYFIELPLDILPQHQCPVFRSLRCDTFPEHAGLPSPDVRI